MENKTETAAEFEKALEAARLSAPMNQGIDGREWLVVPNGFSHYDVTDPDRLPNHVKQSLTTDDADSLIAYANRFSSEQSILIADIDKLSISAHLDWHNHNQSESKGQPQQNKHRATLQLRESEEFKRWNDLENQMVDQMAFAEFLDENACDIATPDPATMIEIARDLEATQGVNFKASTRLQTGERSITYESETHTKGDMTVPTQFTLEIPLFMGEPPVEIIASFRFRVSAGGLKLGYAWRRVEYRRLAEFKAIATRISESTGLPVIFGRS
jgi:uncharacterized protein YfdQ (DUF2303 family)